MEPRQILEMHYLIRLARQLDRSFESLLLTGQVAKWYSEIGNEATTVGSAYALEPHDTLLTLHRDLGAILTQYCDISRLCPHHFPHAASAPDLRRHPQEYLRTLACQLLGRAGGFSEGVERSFHYGFIEESSGINHIGMISHLGSMIPVAAGAALASKMNGDGRVALNYIGDGGTSTGDFHEGLNLAAVLDLPMILLIENNQYAFSTPTNEQYRCSSLASKAEGYGIPGVVVDGNDPEAVHAATVEAVARARAGKGPTLIEAVLGRLTGHAVGDGSYEVLPEAERAAYEAADPVPAGRRALLARGLMDEALDAHIEECTQAIVDDALEHGLAAPRPDAAIAHRSPFADSSALAEETH